MIFTFDWFSHHASNWERHLAPYKGKSCVALEIGCFEGKATLWLLENILTHEHSRICCIDHFQGSEEHSKLGIDFTPVKKHFLHNTEQYKEKIILLEDYCEVAMFKLEPNSYNIIYIDGSHKACNVLRDIVISFELLKNNGLMIMDDYAWDAFDDPQLNPRLAIDAFLHIYQSRITLLHKGYQVIIKKGKT